MDQTSSARSGTKRPWTRSWMRSTPKSCCIRSCPRPPRRRPPVPRRRRRFPPPTATPSSRSPTRRPVPDRTGAPLVTSEGTAAGVANQTLALVSKGAGQVDLAHLHASGTALGKLKLFATSGLTSLAAGSGVAVFEYDATVTQWRLLAHDQGPWITPAYAGTDYTAATGTWTVDSGDVIELRYWLKGRTLFVKVWLLTTSVSATPAELRRAIPGGFTVAGNDTITALQVANAGGGAAVGMVSVGATIAFYSSIGGAGWSAATNNTSVNGKFFCEVAGWRASIRPSRVRGRRNRPRRRWWRPCARSMRRRVCNISPARPTWSKRTRPGRRRKSRRRRTRSTRRRRPRRS